ncbi:extracellular signal-regulated kinase 2-like [Argonauta hians]
MTSDLEAHITKKYDIKKRLGKGAYGIVWKAIDRKTGNIVAVKKIFDAFRNETDAQRTFREIMFLENFSDHPNIIKLHKVIKAENDHDIYLVFEFMDTDLHNVIKRGNILKDVHKRYVMYQLFKATKYLHSGNVIHRDQKPSNILLNSDCLVKLCDFGLARSLTQIVKDEKGDPNLTEYVATRWYRAPEILLGSHRYTKGVDMWSLGCILGEMLLGKPLFPGASTINQIEIIMSTIEPPDKEDIDYLSCMSDSSILENVKVKEKKSLREMLKNVPPEAVDLVLKLLHFNPDKRITVEDSLHHPYVARFHDPSEEVSVVCDVVPSLTDDVLLSVEDYRHKLYEMIVEKKLQMKKSNITQRKEKLFSKENQKTLSPLITSGKPYSASVDAYKGSFHHREPSKLHVAQKVKPHQLDGSLNAASTQPFQNHLKPVSRCRPVENPSNAANPTSPAETSNKVVNHNNSAPIGSHHHHHHHQRPTSSITAMVQGSNPTITRDKFSPTATGSTMHHSRSESAGPSHKPVYGRRQFHNVVNSSSSGGARYTFGSYSQAYGTISASGLAALNKRKN